MNNDNNEHGERWEGRRKKEAETLFLFFLVPSSPAPLFSLFRFSFLLQDFAPFFLRETKVAVERICGAISAEGSP